MIKELKEVRGAFYQLFYLHQAELEGLTSGKPSSRAWIEAVDKVEEALAKLDGVIEKLESPELAEKLAEVIYNVEPIEQLLSPDVIPWDAVTREIKDKPRLIAQAAINVILDKGEV